MWFVGIVSSEREARAGSGLGGIPYSFGNGTDTPANLKKIKPLVEQLKKNRDAGNPFGKNAGLGLTEQDATALVHRIQRTVDDAVELANLRLGKEAAGWLRDQLKNGGICLSWGNSNLASADTDKTTAKKASEKIALGAKHLVSEGPLQTHSPALVFLAQTLLHETLHVCQSFEVAQNSPDPKAELGKVTAENEVTAHRADAARQNQIAGFLGNPNLVNPAIPLPEDLPADVREILSSIRGLCCADDRNAAALKLKKALEDRAKFDRDAAACYELAALAFRTRLQVPPTMTRDEFVKYMNENEWKAITSMFGNVYNKMTQPKRIEQFSPETGQQTEFDVDVDRVMSFAEVLSSKGSGLLVVGRGADGLGKLLFYEDINGDEFFEPETMRVLFEGESRLRNNMSLIQDPDSGNYFVYDSATMLFYPLVDTDSDQVPDQLLVSVNAPFSGMDEYLTYLFDPTAPVPTILGYEPVDSMEPAIRHNGRLMVLRDPDNDGFFDEVYETTWDDYVTWDPTLEFPTLVDGSREIAVYGVPSAAIQLWSTDVSGKLIQLLGSTVGAGVPSAQLISLNRPVVADEEVVVVDLTNERSSPNLTVGSGILSPIPAVSAWGLVVLTLLLLNGAKIYFARRQTVTAS